MGRAPRYAWVWALAIAGAALGTGRNSKERVKARECEALSELVADHHVKDQPLPAPGMDAPRKAEIWRTQAKQDAKAVTAISALSPKTTAVLVIKDKLGAQLNKRAGHLAAAASHAESRSKIDRGLLQPFPKEVLMRIQEQNSAVRKLTAELKTTCGK